MMATNRFQTTAPVAKNGWLSPQRAWTLLLLVYLAVHFLALFSPSLLDDADATHASAARHMALSGDWVTLYVNGVRYLEKPPLPYWLVAVDYHLFGFNVFATHLPMSLSILATAMLAWVWARRAYGDKAAFYAALGMLTSIGIFLFTRILIPEALLTFLIGLALYCFLTGLEDHKPERFYITYAALALAVLTKGLIAPVFFLGAAIPYSLLTGTWRRWREWNLLYGTLLFLAIAAPWHILAGMRNPDQGHPVGNVPSPGNVHGFYYFYFVNEHVLRFLGKRYPHDYNKLPAILYWSLHLVWLAPWSLFAPVALRRAWESRREWLNDLRPYTPQTVDFYIEQAHLANPATEAGRLKFRARTNWLLALYAAFILLFFSLSTNQEYYTYPAYMALVMLTVGALAQGGRPAGQGEPLADGGTGGIRGDRGGRGRGVGIWIVGFAEAPICAGHRYTSGASSGGRLFAVDVALLRSDGAIVCCVARTCGAGGAGVVAGADDRMGIAAEGTTPGGDDFGGVHGGGVPGGGAYRAGAV